MDNFNVGTYSFAYPFICQNIYFSFQAFHSAYKFVDDIREKEISILKKKLKKEKNPEEKEKVKYLVQRMVSWGKFLKQVLY